MAQARTEGGTSASILLHRLLDHTRHGCNETSSLQRLLCPDRLAYRPHYLSGALQSACNGPLGCQTVACTVATHPRTKVSPLVLLKVSRPTPFSHNFGGTPTWDHERPCSTPLWPRMCLIESKMRSEHGLVSVYFCETCSNIVSTLSRSRRNFSALMNFLKMLSSNCMTLRVSLLALWVGAVAGTLTKTENIEVMLRPFREQRQFKAD